MDDPALPQRRPFLSARWERLCLVTWAIDPDLLTPHLPAGLTLDTIDGNAFISLVAFDFLDTRVLGISWPGYRNFPEINLRFYVRHGTQRGVVFLREYVPKHLISWIARTIYNEPYTAAPMTSTWTETLTTSTLQHTLRVGKRDHHLTVTLENTRSTPAEDSTEHFFKEHSFGYGQTRRNALLSYQVWHPIWQTMPVQSHELDWDFSLTYGHKWAFLNHTQPSHVTFAVGSQIHVYPHQTPT